MPPTSALVGDRHRPLRNVVCDEIREGVIRGDFRPGDRLIEERLAQDLGVSRNPVREALRILETEGFIRIIPRRGAIVAGLTESDAQQIFEVRGALEPLAARLAARNARPQQASQMRKLIEGSEASVGAADPIRLGKLNSAFHDLVLDMAANSYLRDIMAPLRGRTQWIFAHTAGQRGVDAWREHGALSAAILAGDEDAASTLAEEHVAVSCDLFLKTWRKRDLEVISLKGLSG